ncbi:membrane protein [Clostridia bacterium]|nr:membrane protein [Clostridia bacterium]
MNAIILTMLLTDLIIIPFCAFTPYFTRKTELFGVSIPESESQNPECRKFRKGYAATMLFFGAVMLLLTFIQMYGADQNDTRTVLWPMVTIFGYLIASFIVYLGMRSKMLELKAKNGWQSPRDGLPAVMVAVSEAPQKDIISSAWLLIYPLIFLITIAGLMIAWPHVPDPYPSHFNIEGVADAWTAKTISSTFFLLGTQLVMAAMFIGIHFVVKHSKRQIDAQNPEKSMFQLKVYRRMMSMMMLLVGAATNLLFAGIQVIMILPGVSTGVFFGVSLTVYMLVVILGCIRMYMVGQGGSRVKFDENKGETAEVQQININDDKYWILGILYCNPKDPSVFVEKRFGIGYTVNIGTFGGMAFMAGIVIILVGSIVLTVMAL